MEILNKKIAVKVERPIRIMQFGEGNFLRAFIDWFFNEMNKQANFNANVVVVQPLANGRIKELKDQDGLYTLIMEGYMDGKTIEQHELIDVFNDYINPYMDYDKYLKYAESSDLEMIISNTTESGIVLDKSDLAFEHTPNSYPGKLLALLKKRYDHFNGDMNKGLLIVACELIDNNGDELKRCLVSLANLKGFDESFIKWLETANKYYNTLVDRIVPGYPRADEKKLWEKFGYIDNNMVKGEAFHLWVIEGDPKIKNFLPFEKTNLNILFTDNIKPYKERKVKILNGAHTCMVPVAYLGGLRYVKEVMDNQKYSKFVGNFIEEEVLPTITLPKDEILAFKGSVFDRFKNPFVHHELITISLNSMTKYKTRILPSVVTFYEINHELPRYALFSLAALFNLYFEKQSDGSSLVSDDQCFIDKYASLANATPEEIISALLLDTNHWGYDFNKMGGSYAFVLECFSAIRNDGIQKAMHNIMGI